MSLRRILTVVTVTGGLCLLSACTVVNELGAEGLPTQYPLMPGDAVLWPQLDDAQRARALSFLASGSTIQSSILGDY